MLEPRAHAVQHRRGPTLDVSPSRLSARLGADAPSHVAVVLDGVVRAVLPVESGGFAWELPHDLLGRLLDVVATDTGASLIGGPVAFDAYRRVRWTGWRLEGRVVRGGFMLEGVAVPDTAAPIPVELRGASHGRGFARRRGDAYSFEIALAGLPGHGGGEIRPQVGTALLPEALHVPAEAFDHLGSVDAAEPWAVRGWAARRDGSPAPVSVALWLDGRKVASAVADRVREDVAAQGLGDRRSGFVIPFPPSLRLDRPMLVDVRVAPHGPSLANSPYVQPPAPPYFGFVDTLDEFHIGGWVIGTSAPERPVQVEAVCDGRPIATATADLRRLDVAAAGLPNGRCGFRIEFSATASELLDRDVSVRVVGTEHILRGSPRRLVPNPNIAAFLRRRETLGPALEARLARHLSHRTRDGLLSIVMPVHETRQDWLIAAIESVRAQWSRNWELICVDDGSRASHVGSVLATFARADPRIRILPAPSNVGIARAVNFGLRAARGAYVAFVDHDDALEPDAVYHLLKAARQTGADLIYSDEVLTGSTLDQLLDLRARPAFSHDFYLSHPYFVHLVCVRTRLAQELAGYDESLAISADIDFVLRAIERANAVAHIPRPLYRWRTHEGSAGHQMRDEVVAATQGALTRHLHRLGHRASVKPGPGFNQFRIDWPDDGGHVLIVIPTKDRVDLLRTCIESVERSAAGDAYRIVVIDHQSTDKATTAYLHALAERHTVMPYDGPFNYSRMNNQAVRRHGAGARYLLFLNNDVEAIETGWLGRLRSLARRKDVGAVGPLLLYGSGQVQHAGVVVGFHGGADHAMRFREPFDAEGGRNPGVNTNLVSVRDYSAVTAACLMMRRTVFEQVGGFDEDFAIGYNDTDLCLRLRQAGLAVLYDGQTILKHHESATRGTERAPADPQEDTERLRARWPAYFDQGDPFYHPLLAASGTDHQLRMDDGWKHRLGERTVRPALRARAPAGAERAPAARITRNR